MVCFHYSKKDLAVVYVSVLLMFFSEFMVSGLAPRSLIHFEFIFVYIIRKCSNFILLHAAVQFSQHHLLKRPYHGFYSLVLSSQISGEKKKNQNLREEKTTRFILPFCLPSFVSYSGFQQFGQEVGFWAKDVGVGNTGFQWIVYLRNPKHCSNNLEGLKPPFS